MSLTKQDLEAVGDIVDKKIQPLRSEMQAEFALVHKDINALCEQIQQLTITLDKFLKRLTDHEEEFTILKSEMKQVKQVLKEKLGVDFKGVANW